MTKRIQRRRRALAFDFADLADAAHGRPRFQAAAIHRVVTTLTRTRTDPFLGCAFTACTEGPDPACTSRCVIHASLTPEATDA